MTKSAFAQQAYVPGMEDSAIAEIEEAALEQISAATAFKEASDACMEAEQRVIAAMREAGKTVYRRNRSDGLALLVKISESEPKTKAKSAFVPQSKEP